MTEAEKAEYRQRRIVKACDKCSKRKRKCNHNQPASVDAPAKSIRTKVAKPSISSTKKPVHVPDVVSNETENFDMQPFDNNFVDPWLADMQCFDTFTTILDDTDFSVDSLFPTDGALYDQEWQWPLIGDMPLFNTIKQPAVQYNDSPGNIHSQTSSSSSAQSRSSTHTPERCTDISDMLMTDISENTTTHRADSHAGSSATTTNMHWTSYANMLDGFLDTSQGDGLPPDKSGTKDDHTDKPQPQHTAHAHEFQGNGAFVHEDRVQEAYPSGSRPRTSVARMNGTARAVRAFGGLLRTNSALETRLQSVTIDTVAPPAQSLRIPGKSEELSRSLDRPHALVDRRGSREGRSGSLDGPGSLSRSLDRPEALVRISRESDSLSRGTGRLEQRRPTPSDTSRGYEVATAGPLEVIQIRDYLRMKNNVSDMEKGSSSPGRIASGGLNSQEVPPASSIRERKSGLATNPAPGSSRGMLQDILFAALEGRSTASLGGTTMDNVAVPTTDYFLLRRGLQRSSSHAASHLTTAPTSLLQVRTTSDCSCSMNASLQVNTASCGTTQVSVCTEAERLRESAGVAHLLQTNTVSSSVTVLATQVSIKQTRLNASTLRTLLAILGCLILAYTLVTTSDVVRPSFILLALLSPVVTSGSSSVKFPQRKLNSGDQSWIGRAVAITKWNSLVV